MKTLFIFFKPTKYDPVPRTTLSSPPVSTGEKPEMFYKLLILVKNVFVWTTHIPTEPNIYNSVYLEFNDIAMLGCNRP